MQLHVATPPQAAGRSAQVGSPGVGRPPVPALSHATPLHAARQYWFGPQVRSPQPTPLRPEVPAAAVVVPAAPVVMDPPLPASDTLPACPPTLLPAQTRHTSTRPPTPALRPPPPLAPPVPPWLMPEAPALEPPAWLAPPTAAPSAPPSAPHAPIANESRTDAGIRRLTVRFPQRRPIAPARVGRSLMGPAQHDPCLEANIR